MIGITLKEGIGRPIISLYVVLPPQHRTTAPTTPEEPAMSLRTMMSRTPRTASPARVARSLERALQRPLTPSSAEELLYLTRR